MSRAEIIKQKGGTVEQHQQHQQQQESIRTWMEQIFPAFFAAFQGRYSALFPPSHIIPPIVTSDMSSIPQPIAVDDQYAWQFLAAVSVGATPDQQRVLVAEVRYVAGEQVVVCVVGLTTSMMIAVLRAFFELVECWLPLRLIRRHAMTFHGALSLFPRPVSPSNRDKIFETVGTQASKGKDKVNIFLNALGLDASQLTG